MCLWLFPSAPVQELEVLALVCVGKVGSCPPQGTGRPIGRSEPAAGPKRGGISCKDRVTSAGSVLGPAGVFFHLQHQPHSENEGRGEAQSSLPPPHPSGCSSQGCRDALVQDAAFGTITVTFLVTVGMSLQRHTSPGEPREAVTMQEHSK